MASLNQVTLIGNLTRDPESRYIPSGAAVTKFGLAINENYKDKGGEWVKKVVFIDIVAWQGLAETCAKYLHKGSAVCVVGSLNLNSWEADDGQKRSKLEVVAREVKFLDPKKQEGSGEKNEADYDVPF